jgi:serine phosphatase RsbU (regulator of sigma subunit)
MPAGALRGAPSPLAAAWDLVAGPGRAVCQGRIVANTANRLIVGMTHVGVITFCYRGRVSRAGVGDDRVIRYRPALIVLALPFAVLAVVGMAGLLEQDWGLLPLLAVAPAIAAVIGGLGYTLAVGVAAMAGCVLLELGLHPGADHRGAQVAFLAAAGVTAAAVLASRVRRRRNQELAQVRVVAEAVQKVLLRPVPRQAGPVGLAVRYLSASSGARVGGDLYEVASTSWGLRLIVGDVQGNGLPAVQQAAAVLGVFREAAYDEDSLAGIAARIEAILARQLDDEQFVTAILAEVAGDGAKAELLSCGHPAPLLLGEGPARYAGTGEETLPLGLGRLACQLRVPVTIPFSAGTGILFYTDGASETRNKAGEFFPLADCESVRIPADPATLVDRLADEVTRYAGHAPDDDVALLLAYRSQPR